MSKRQYRKGYYVVWHKSKTTESTSNSKTSDVSNQHSKVIQTNSAKRSEMKANELELTASAKNSLEEIPNLKKSVFYNLPNDSCDDILVYRDGAELTVKVVEVFNGTIKYLPCNNLSGPLRVTNSEKVFMIKYANGTKEVLQEPAKSTSQLENFQTKKSNNVKKINGMAMASFICSIFGFFLIPAILAMIFGIIALNLHRKYPDRYKAMWMAKFGIVAGAIWLGLILLSSI